MDKVDITIIGAGVVGLACAYELSTLGKDIIVLEKNERFGEETSSRNSEVIHAGIHYPKESLKTALCVEGNNMLYEYCQKNGIQYKKTGKYTVAYDEPSRVKIEKIYKHGIDCGVKGLEMVPGEKLKSIEPLVKADEALFSPTTGIFDTHSFMKSLFLKAKERGVNFVFGTEVAGIKKEGGAYLLNAREPAGGDFEFISGVIINAAGLNSDRVCSMAGIDTLASAYKIYPCKGQYFRIEHPQKFGIRHLVYPAPSDHALGIHVVLDMAGGIRLGPDAKYVQNPDYTINEQDKYGFADSVKRFIPSIGPEDLIADTAGIRPKLQGPSEPFRDFVIAEESARGLKNFISLVGIDSPGLTASLALAMKVRNFI